MTTVKRQMLLPLTLVLATLGLMIAAQGAGAMHVRPKGATPFRVPLVPAYQACATPNRQHGPPLAFSSCNPPVQGSSFLTVGTPDANGATAKAIGSVLLNVVPSTCCPPQDLAVTANISDVRCKPATGAAGCANANAVGGPDYAGQLQSNATIRITDDWNSVSAGGGTDPATVIDIPFPLQFDCVNTADTSIGATCTVNTSAVAVGAPSPNVDRANVEISQLQVSDGGADGQVSTTPNTLFAIQGLFIP
jgi:hypothetical protein